MFLYVPWPDGDEASYPDPIHSWNELSAPGYATVCINKKIHRQQLNVSLGAEFLSQVCQCASEDCGKCKELRKKQEQDRRKKQEQDEQWEKQKAQVAALKAKEQSEKKRQAEEAKRSRKHAPWRCRKVTARDEVKANGGSLGPLTRALSPEMKVTLGTQFLRKKAISWLWPHPEMDGLQIEKWMQGDPWFKWVEKIPDDILLDLCDKRFGVQRTPLWFWP